MERKPKLVSPGVATERTCLVHIQPNAGEFDAHIRPVFETFSPYREDIFAEPVWEGL